MKKVQDAEELIINSIRIISVDEEFDAFTLDIDFFNNSSYFVEMMNIASSKQFLYKELVITKDPTKLASSVLDKCLLQDAYQNKPYFTCIPFATGENQLPQKFTLGQMLLFLIQKMINVQYQDYNNRLTAPQQHFFFLPGEPKLNNLSQTDLKLTNYWVKLPGNDRDNFFRQMTDIQNQLTTEDHLKKGGKTSKAQCAQIKEEDYGDGGTEGDYGDSSPPSRNEYDS